METHAFLFWVIALLTGLCAIATVVTQNIVRAATWLLFTLAGTSGLFFLLGADLVGAIQLLVYVGGTLILVVFGVMLTAQGPFINMKTSGAEWAISAVAGLLLLAVLVIGVQDATSETGPPKGSVVAKYAPDTRLADSSPEHRKLMQRWKKKDITREEFETEWSRLERSQAATSSYSAVIGQSLLGVGLGPAHEETVGKEKRIIRAHYLLPFEIVSVHLLVVLIGAAYLARAKRRRSAVL